MNLFQPFPFKAVGVDFTVPLIVFLFVYYAALLNAALWLSIGLVEAAKYIA